MNIGLRLTTHALERARKLDAIADANMVIGWWDEGTPVSPDVLWAITQRKNTPSPTDQFRLAPDVPGILVVSIDPASPSYAPTGTVVTILRLQPSQLRILAPERGDTAADATDDTPASANTDSGRSPHEPGPMAADPVACFAAIGVKLEATAAQPPRAWVGQLGKTAVHVRRFGGGKCTLALRGPGGTNIATVTGISFEAAALVTSTVTDDRR